MNKCLLTIGIVVFAVALAEIYLALYLYDKGGGGQWNITLNWTVEGQSSQPSWTHFLYPSQESTKLLINASIPEEAVIGPSNSVNSYQKTQLSKHENQASGKNSVLENIVEGNNNFIEKMVRVKRSRKPTKNSRKHLRKLPSSESEKILINIFKPKKQYNKDIDCGFHRGDFSY